MQRKVSIVALLVLGCLVFTAFGQMKWVDLTEYEVVQGGHGGVSIKIYNTSDLALDYIMLQFKPKDKDGRPAVKVETCIGFGSGGVAKIENGYTSGIYFAKGAGLTPGGMLLCDLKVKDAAVEQLLGYIENPKELVVKLRGLKL